MLGHTSAQRTPQPSSCSTSLVSASQADLVERLAELLKQAPSYTCRQTAATEQACTDLRQYLHARWGLPSRPALTCGSVCMPGEWLCVASCTIHKAIMHKQTFLHARPPAMCRHGKAVETVCRQLLLVPGRAEPLGCCRDGCISESRLQTCGSSDLRESGEGTVLVAASQPLCGRAHSWEKAS